MSHTVLVVEDEQELREMMRDALELNGYAVVTAEHGRDALAKLPAIANLCLVILDLVMPVMDGWELVPELRGQSAGMSVPIVVYTSGAGQAPTGVTRVVQKPLAFDRLLSIVREYCAQ
jgi:CheY-like chemotaxis protein